MRKSLPRCGLALALTTALVSCQQPLETDAHADSQQASKAAGSAVLLADKLASENHPNPHFFFLPPLAPKEEYTGAFADDLQPIVRVSVVEGDTMKTLAEFSMEGKASERVRMESDGELGGYYLVNFHLNRYALPLHSTIVIEVLVDDELLGSIPAIIVPNGAEKDPAGAVLKLVRNRTVPVKFRIEKEYFQQIGRAHV